MDVKKTKEGFSVKEIETFAKKHKFEVFLCLVFLLSFLFSFVFFSSLSAPMACVGGILGILFPAKVENIFKRCAAFFHKQEETTQLVLGIAMLILSIFLPIVIFLAIGCCAGKYFLQLSSPSSEKKED